MLTFKILSKLLLMEFLYLGGEIWGLIKRRKGLEGVKKVGILFLPNLGIGDLVMLSPAIKKIGEIFQDAEVFLITWVEPIIDFGKIKIIGIPEFQKIKKSFDLLISPTLNLRHFPFIFQTKYWLGYFAKPKIQSNFGAKKLSYHLKKEHYLWRGIRLLKALNEEEGNLLEKKAKERSIVYPELISQEPSFFKELKGEKYLALAPISKWPDRQWPLEKFSELIRQIFNKRLFNKIVILGGKTQRERELANVLLAKNLEKIPKDFFIDTVGKTSLSETIFLIKHSSLFIGLDSAPAHFAYLTASRVLVIFITVDPLFRLPLTKTNNLIRCLYPSIFIKSPSKFYLLFF